MARVKIDYGIDLGTTNSAICRMEKGEPVIIKTDVLKDTMPSCISINKKGSIKAGDSAYNTMKQDKRRATKSWHQETSKTYIEFKRTMGTDTPYHCSNLNRNFISEELSSEVLKTLKSFVTDETITSAVITVPAKFTVNQKTATIEAAKLAGFKRCELLQEPIAASMAYGLNTDEKDGIWMVFDFGGGTFDAALLKVEDGIMQVFDTEGDNYLGGKNLDYAIVDEIIIPYLKENYSINGILADEEKKQVLQDAMKTYAEDAKNQLSFKAHEDIISNLGDLGEDEDGEEIELDLTIKLIAEAVLDENDNAYIYVIPTMLNANNMLSKVDYAFNAITVVGDRSGDTVFYGSGAGGRPTSSAIVSDAVTLARNTLITDELRIPILGFVNENKNVKVKDFKEKNETFYVRFKSEKNDMKFSSFCVFCHSSICP